MKLGELLDALKQTYCGPIGAEYMHITSTEEKRWINSASNPVVRPLALTRKTLPERTDRR